MFTIVAKLFGVSDEAIEESRKRVGVPDDWDVDWCANACGDFVFYPPGAREAAEEQGTPFVVTCTSECLEELLHRRRLDGRLDGEDRPVDPSSGSGGLLHRFRT